MVDIDSMGATASKEKESVPLKAFMSTTISSAFSRGPEMLCKKHKILNASFFTRDQLKIRNLFSQALFSSFKNICIGGKVHYTKCYILSVTGPFGFMAVITSSLHPCHSFQPTSLLLRSSSVSPPLALSVDRRVSDLEGDVGF